mmetsp:Transcript_393/g.671  ORF Transcript_393/g.671 Transcript_393/m.671 type:complete len:290 (+) Transcript_393:180-1049(+)
MGNIPDKDHSKQTSAGFVNVFDVISGAISLPTHPQCLDELVDWCEEAERLETSLQCRETYPQSIRSDAASRLLVSRRFITLVRRDMTIPALIGNGRRSPIELLFQTDSSKIFILVQTPIQQCSSDSRNDTEGEGSAEDVSNSEGKIMSVGEFSTLFCLLRRLDQLVQAHLQYFEPVTSNVHLKAETTEEEDDVDGLEDPECVICMDSQPQIVLPCMHSFCSACATKWVEKHLDCPVCRGHISRKTLRKEQWQVCIFSITAQGLVALICHLLSHARIVLLPFSFFVSWRL